ncbi:hypothetical protein POF51_26085 [Brevibacillus sp. AG]|uniref:hypothetical protein n=1 Tax=Brevibacillus sp. AG TaxID=3020891 RepID=UPI00232AB3D4|nr:hypothetical protein [Brevibacillus sp. AG]MDC0764194.1 hypothetical protein [Brevibacillus sp. AG]
MKRVENGIILFGVGVILLGLWLQHEEEQQVTNSSQQVSVQQDKVNSSVQHQETSTEEFTRIIKGAVITYEGIREEAANVLLNENMTKEEKEETYKNIMADVVDARNAVINMQLSVDHSKELAQKSADMLFSFYHALNESRSLIDLNHYYKLVEDKKAFEETINAKNKIISEHSSTAEKLREELRNSSLFK